MTSDAHFEDRRTTEQAAWWLLTLQSEQLSATERAEFIDWLRESPLHISEMLRACRLQRDLTTFKGWHLIAQMNEAQSSNVVTLLERRLPSAAEGLAGHSLRNRVLLAA